MVEKDRGQQVGQEGASWTRDPLSAYGAPRGMEVDGDLTMKEIDDVINQIMASKKEQEKEDLQSHNANPGSRNGAMDNSQMYMDVLDTTIPVEQPAPAATEDWAPEPPARTRVGVPAMRAWKSEAALHTSPPPIPATPPTSFKPVSRNAWAGLSPDEPEDGRPARKIVTLARRSMSRTGTEEGPVGLGMRLDMDPLGNIIVSHVLHGGPAFESGKVFVGDTLLEADGQSLNGLSLGDATQLLLGEMDTFVTLELLAGTQMPMMPSGLPSQVPRSSATQAAAEPHPPRQ
eukprot:CAMPEP_0206236564 /NCGR_PEP_ID=MMETSP0047_2-20121206/13787_1 /ASSEMBLY_ACC=CAM_ASM_000192 /TAXON_ID=195065 /ORGANISM="Chroomonas mesostigmatica_cf, Strain CCMP1168" /LENGTH=287 /DNA_ID=CAMNT_0053660917 /DNA_START=158 /DNA_END=1018 /DNA_ORIENTATION=+